MKVKNINGRRQNSCKCGTWLDHWVKICGQPLPQHCAATTCMGAAQLGAHVQKDCASDSGWYILPLCVKHSMRAALLEISDTTLLVSADVNETCGKQMPIGNVCLEELRVTIATNASKYEKDVAKAQEKRGVAVGAMPRLYGKRRIGRVEPPALRLMY
jgi:hypothetical protein